MAILFAIWKLRKGPRKEFSSSHASFIIKEDTRNISLHDHGVRRANNRILIEVIYTLLRISF